MENNIKIKLFDVVALVENLSKRGLIIGQVGTVVDILDDGVFEVEFCDNDGKTYDCLALRKNQLMPLHYSPAAA